jgi:hypothetical protein
MKNNTYLNSSYVAGFVKRAADYGVEADEALALLKSANSGGPYTTEQAAKAQALDLMVRSNVYNRENHPGHYYANPLVQGPISEIINRLRRRHAMGASDDRGGYVDNLLGAAGPAVNAIRGGKQEHFDRTKNDVQKYLAGLDAGYGAQ